MAEQVSIAKCPSSKSTTTVSRRRSLWPSVLHWIPTSTDHISPPRNAFSFSSKTEAWFVDSIKERSRVKNISNLIVLGHSFGGYIASKYALKHPKHVQHLILVGPAGFSSESDSSIEWLTCLRETWKRAILNRLWESNFTPQKIVRFVYLVQFSKPTTINQGFGPWGPKIVHKYTATRFDPRDSAEFVLAEKQNKLLTDYAYHISAAKASGELCLKHIFSFGALPRVPLLKRLGYTACASEWKVPTTFIYWTEDWMNYQGAQDTTKVEQLVPPQGPRASQLSGKKIRRGRQSF
ncbi:hypothetical protein PVK06_016271 [Gossypium arboreum]|uniref:AB hydrolase-1 domain-containing protein n=1 Tax=Gossypium arboreum TaxID=29729 RepID=A0ABR0PZY8_GOSAR|nr:hypothetical protein PVK06_016271 [Gossypium arboreum]